MNATNTFGHKSLVLKPISFDYVDVIFNAIKGNVAEYFYDFKDTDEVRTWIKNAIKKHAEGKKLEYVIFEDGEFIGVISPCYLTSDTVEIGMWIASQKQGRGCGTKALSELLVQLRSEGVKQVLYETESNNEPSVRRNSKAFSGPSSRWWLAKMLCYCRSEGIQLFHCNGV